MTNNEAIAMIRNDMKLHHDSLSGKYRKALRMAINALEKRERWIPVTEWLPENNEEVLTTYIVNGNKNKRYTETATYYDDDEGDWLSPWDEYREAGARIEVVAWMPLPDPWKGDRNDCV